MMIQSFFENKEKIWQYVVLWCIFAALQTLSFAGLVNVSVYVVMADSVFLALMYAFAGILIWSVVRFGNFQSLPTYQRIINHIALAILTIVAVVGVTYIFESMISESFANAFLPFIYIRGLETILIYIAFTQYYELMICRNIHQEEPEIDIPELPDITNTTSNGEQPEDVEILERIAVKSGQKIHVVMIPEIICLQADGDYVHIFTETGKYLKEQTMKYFEVHLPSSMFVRVHRSCIVNVSAISRIELYEKQNQQLTLKNGQQIKVSQAGYKALRQKLNL